MQRKKRRCSLFVTKFWEFLGVPLTPHPKVFKTFKLPQVQLEFSRHPISDTISVGPELIPKVLAWGACPPNLGRTKFTKNLQALPDDES